MAVYIQPEFCKYTGRTIYKLIFPDRKVYIGLASIFHKRIEGHNSEAYAKTDGDWKDKSRCKNAIREFGWDNVQVEIMEFVPKYASLRDRETYWIAQYQSWKKEYGYNSNKGGGGPMAGVYKHTEEAKAKISAANSKPVTSCKILEEYPNGTQLVEFVSYASATEAERQTVVHNAHITKCCNKKKKSAGGFIWFFTKQNHPPQIIKVGTIRVPRIGDKPQLYKRAVISTSPDGENQRHESAYAAVRTLSELTKKKFDFSAISKCCKGKCKSHHGYTFCYE